MKKVMVTSCSHSHGWRSVRVTTSQMTVTVNPEMAMPHSTISASSSGSSARHFRWRWVCWTSEGMAPALLDVAHHVQDLDGVGTEVLGELVLDGFAHGLEAGLVDRGDDLDADLLQARARVTLHLEGLGRLHLVHVVGGL